MCSKACARQRNERAGFCNTAPCCRDCWVVTLLLPWIQGEARSSAATVRVEAVAAAAEAYSSVRA